MLSEWEFNNGPNVQWRDRTWLHDYDIYQLKCQKILTKDFNIQKKFNTIITRGHKQITLISKEWYQRTLCSEGSASFLVQKNLLIEYHRNLSTGFIIEPFFCVQINHMGKKLLFLMFKEITLKRRSALYKLFNSLDFSETKIWLRINVILSLKT